MTRYVILSINNLIGFGLILISGISGQLSLSGCPTGWVKQNSECYKFAAGSPKIYEEADSICWTYGARLLSIDTYQEHQFVANWLMQNDALFLSTWFTSGFYSGGKLVWEGENSAENVAGQFWITSPDNSVIYNHVAYKVGGPNSIGYGWTLVSSSVPANYICEISQADSVKIDMLDRDFGYGHGFVDPETLPHGPEMITEPKGVVVFGSGRAIYLQCEAHSLPAAHYTWYRGDGRNETIDSATNSRYTLTDGRFTIEAPDQEIDSEVYGCSAENDDGVILSSMVRIMFGYLHAFPPVKPEDSVGTAYEGVRINCYTPAYNPAVVYTWFKFHTHNYIFPNHPYHFVSQSGYLYFSEVQPTDDRKYYCVVTLDAPDTMVADSTLPPSRVSLGSTLIIRPGKTNGNYGPIIHTHAFPSPALRLSTIRLECVAFGSLPLSYSWHREGGIPFVKGTKQTARNRVLTIPNAPLEAEGNYVCTVKRGTDRGVTRTSIIVLIMEAKPYFANPIKNMLVDPGQNVKWRCKAVARPKATYTWYKNGKLIENVQGSVEAQGNILIINNVGTDNEGMYQCAATNQHGTTFSSGQLKILSFVPNFDKFPMRTSVLGASGGNLTIECRVEGAPLPTVRWLKNGADMNLIAGLMDGRVGMTTRNALVLTSIQLGDQGNYTCEASNVNGEAQNSTRVRVVQGVVIDQPPVPGMVVVNRTHFLFCAASYNANEMDLTYQWLYNTHPINFKRNNHFVKGMHDGVSGLYIRNAQYTNGGEYTCVARTPLHADKKSAYIQVVGPPGPPAGVYHDAGTVTSYSVRVTWTVGPETGHGSPITSYDIEADTGFEPDTWKVLASDIPEFQTVNDATTYGDRADQRTVVVKGLIPNTEYRFRVRAINQYGRGQEASRPSSSVKTPATIPVIPPQDVGGGDGKVGTLNISWTALPDSEHCGPGIGYKVYWKKSIDPEQAWKRDTLIGNYDGYTSLVGTDNYYIEYNVKVGVFNDLGDGPNSTIVNVYSAMGLPVAVPTITGVNGVNLSTVIVTFDPVPNDREHMKGRIKGYRIQYYWNENGDCSPFRGCDPSFLRNRNIWGQADQVMLIDLEINSEFFFRMQVFNSAGWGPKGEWRRGETATWAPLQYPRFVTVMSLSKHSVQVNWQGVMTTNIEEIITGYKVKWWKVQSDIRNANETTSDRLQTEVVIHSLQTKTVYELRVQGTSAGGDGAMSNAVYFTLLGGQVSIDPGTTEFCYEGATCSSTSHVLPSIVNIFISFLILFLYCNL